MTRNAGFCRTVGVIVQQESEEVEISLKKMFRDTPELRQPLSKEAMTVLTVVDVSVANHVRIVVRNRQMSVSSVVFVDIVVGCVVVPLRTLQSGS